MEKVLSTVFLLLLLFSGTILCHDENNYPSEVSIQVQNQNSMTALLLKELDFIQAKFERKIKELEDWLVEKKTRRKILEKKIEVLKNGHSRGRGNYNGKAVLSSRVKPGNCRDIEGNGQRLNGFYLIKNQDKVEVVYCDFMLPPNQYQTTMGYADIKEGPIHFYVQKEHPYDVRDTKIPFPLSQLNDGEAMSSGDFSSGIFTVPYNGLYHFSFSGVKSYSKQNSLNVQLKKEDNFLLGEAFVGNNEARTLTLSLHSTISLKAGEIVYLYLKDTGTLLDNPSTIYSHFTGWLLESSLNL